MAGLTDVRATSLVSLYTVGTANAFLRSLSIVCTTNPSRFSATCSFCSGVSSVTSTGARDDLEVLCPRCGTHLGSVGELKRGNAETASAESFAAVAAERTR